MQQKTFIQTEFSAFEIEKIVPFFVCAGRFVNSVLKVRSQQVKLLHVFRLGSKQESTYPGTESWDEDEWKKVSEHTAAGMMTRVWMSCGVKLSLGYDIAILKDFFGDSEFIWVPNNERSLRDGAF